MTRRPAAVLLALAAVALPAWLSGCAAGYPSSGLKPGASESQVLAAMGPPNARHGLPGGGTRLEYAHGPMGEETFMVDIDPLGRMTGWEQVLDEAHFDAITPGLSVAQLLASLGRPAMVRSTALQPGQLWIYRYRTLFCRLWQVTVLDGQVHDAGYTPDPRCQAQPDRPR